MLQPSDRKYDQNQTPKLPAKNQPFGAQTFQTLKDMILNLVQAGQGVRVERRGLRVFIHATGAGAGGRGMGAGGGGLDWVVRNTRAELPEPPTTTTLARVDGEDDDDGTVYVANQAHDGWDAINRFE